MSKQERIYCKIGQVVVNTAMMLGVTGTFLTMLLMYIF